MKFGFDWPSGFREKKMFENNGHIHVQLLSEIFLVAIFVIIIYIPQLP